MTDVSPDLIWILDSDPDCIALYQQTLGLQYQVRAFSEMAPLVAALSTAATGEPRLLIADPETTKVSMADFAGKTMAGGGAIRLPEYMIASRVDDLELMRFYLKTGARDYIFKPLRQNELVAKVERALHQISNREILILRNNLDGIHVNDLTFREHQILTIFLSRPERAIKRDDLYAALWSKVTVNRKTLDVHLFNLRRKLRPLGYDVLCQDQIFSLRKVK